MTSSWTYKARQAATFIKTKIDHLGAKPKIFLVLGSGFRDAVNSWTVLGDLEMAVIPDYPAPKVPGLGSKIVFARVKTGNLEQDVIVATGRVHLYEGYSPFEVSLPVMIAHELGIRSVILTNAAGGISDQAQNGSILAIHDHLNITGHNAAAVDKNANSVQFVDMVNAYDSDWRNQVMKDANIKSAVYAAMPGPTYETPAEARMLKVLGADLAGMSTVQEVITARMLGLKVFACSFVTNQAGGMNVDHKDVLTSVKESFPVIQKTLEAAIRHIDHMTH
jgi:purine-nucleoside phosphorylase